MKDNVTTFPGSSPHWTPSEVLEIAARDDVKKNPSVAITIVLSSEGLSWRSSVKTPDEFAHAVAMMKVVSEQTLVDYIDKVIERK